MAAAASEQISLRFRHASGDIGPFTFADSVLFQQVKEKVLSQWPKDGPLANDAPTQAADIKLILSGKFIEASKSIKEYRKAMGEVKEDTIVTLHIVVRPSTTPKKAPGSAPKADEESAKGCSCVVS